MTIDVCRDGCAGVWFDKQEFRDLREPASKAGDVLVALAGMPRVTVDAAERRRCPKCPNSVLMRHFSSAKRAVAVDECPTCAGTWLDGGELEQIRAEYGSGEARRQATQLMMEEILASDRMALMGKQLGEELPYDTSRSRVASSLLVATYMVAAYGAGGAPAALKLLSMCLVPWVCVCFPDGLSGVISPALGTTRASPRSFLWFLGWLVLLVPLVQFVIIWAAMPGLGS